MGHLSVLLLGSWTGTRHWDVSRRTRDGVRGVHMFPFCFRVGEGPKSPLPHLGPLSRAFQVSSTYRDFCSLTVPGSGGHVGV